MHVCLPILIESYSLGIRLRSCYDAYVVTEKFLLARIAPDVSSIWLASDQHPPAAGMQPCTRQCWPMQVVADSDSDLEVGVFLGAYRQLAQRQDLETRRLCAESCAVVLKAATPRRSAAACLQLQWPERTALSLPAVAVAVVALHHCQVSSNSGPLGMFRIDCSETKRIAECFHKEKSCLAHYGLECVNNANGISSRPNATNHFMRLTTVCMRHLGRWNEWVG